VDAVLRSFSDLERSLGIATYVPPTPSRASSAVSVTSNGR